MLKEVRDLLKEGLKERLKGVTVYRGRKDKVKVGGVSFNTINLLLKKDDYFISNGTAIKLIKELDIKIDWDFYYLYNIIKLKHEKEQVQKQEERIQGDEV